jgi:hypothetical protein
MSFGETLAGPGRSSPGARSGDDALPRLRFEEHEALARDGEHDVRAVLDPVVRMQLRLHHVVADAKMDDLLVPEVFRVSAGGVRGW